MGCKRYYITNALGDDEVDITELILIKGYRPIYCEKEICALINPKPYKLNRNDLDRIKLFLIKNNKENLFNNLKTDSLRKNLIYTNSYFIISLPVDVFIYEKNYKNYKIHLEIRVESNNIIFPGKEDDERFFVTPTPARILSRD